MIALTQKKETAEQKLLKMIEASGKGAGSSKSQAKVKSKQNVLSVVVAVNRILTFVVAIAIGLLVKEIIEGTQLISKGMDINFTNTANARVLTEENLFPPVQRLSYYLATAKSRNIFQPYENEAIKNMADVSDKNSRVAQKTGHLRLVGIAWLDRVDTASVMLEDTEKKITYFLMQGEKAGDVIVKNIYADSAVLGYENEEITIRYDKSQM